MRGLAIERDGTYGGLLVWCVYAVNADGSRELLTPSHTLDVHEPQVVLVTRINEQSGKPQKEKRHIDIKVGERLATGESQAAALARVMEEFRKQIVKGNNARSVPAQAVAT